MDTAAWESMLTLNEPSAMVAIDEVHSACANGSVRNPSAFFSSVAKKHRLAMEQGLSNAQPRGGDTAGAEAEAAGTAEAAGKAAAGTEAAAEAATEAEATAGLLPVTGTADLVRVETQTAAAASPAVLAAAVTWTTLRCARSCLLRCTSACRARMGGASSTWAQSTKERSIRF